MEKKPRKKNTESVPKARIKSDDWRNLAPAKWNTRTFAAYFAHMNREHFGVETYLPFRNWGAEQRMVKAAITAHGPELLRVAFDEAFAKYVPTREYPILTAGFAVAYRINAIIPKLLADRQREEREDNAPVTDYTAIKDWL